MLNLNNLEKLHKDRKRVGRGGDLGGTSGRGHKGQKARSGAKIKASFEGGQMCLSRRLPKRGFNNSFKKNVQIINLRDLEAKFNDGDIVNKESLRDRKLVRGKSKFSIKVLGKGEITKKLEIHADAFSDGAVTAIEKAGGKIHKPQER